MKAVWWFHPLVWKIPDAHILACEEEADRVAAARFEEVGVYRTLLAQLALRVIDEQATASPLALTATSHIGRRILQLGQARLSAWNFRRWLGSAATAFILLVLAAGWQFAHGASAASTNPVRAVSIHITVLESGTERPIAHAKIVNHGLAPIEFETDTQGRAVLTSNIPALYADIMDQFNFSVGSPGYGAHTVMWRVNGGHCSG